MIRVIYTEKIVEGEPGPNLLFLGCPEDYLDIIPVLYPLGCKNSIEIVVTNRKNVMAASDHSVIFRSKENGDKLISKIGNNIFVELDKTYWIRIIGQFLSVSFGSSFQYIEFDNDKLIEEANFIIRSTQKANEIIL